MDSVSIEKAIISYVEQNPHIYDKSNRNHLDETMCNNTWITVGADLGLEAEFVKKKWNLLRDRFVRAYRILQSAQSLGSAECDEQCARAVKIFPYINDMLWLAPYLRRKKLSTSMNPRKPMLGPSSTSEVCHKPKRPKPTENSDMEESSQDSNFHEVLVDKLIVAQNNRLSTADDIERLDSASATTETRSKKLSAASKNELDENTSKAAFESFSMVMQTKNQPVTQLPCSCSLHHIAEDMRLLSPINQIKFKRDVMNLLVSYLDKEKDENK